MKLPLPIYESQKVGEQSDFDIVVGLDKNLVEQLKKYSNDESDVELQQNTGDYNRFSIGSYEEWYKKTRTPFALVQKNTGLLAALVWAGPKPAHEGCKCHAVAWRSYRPFRGTGIMKNFSKFVLDYYIEHTPNTNLWVKIKKENSGSLGLAKYLGFIEDETLATNESIILGKKVVEYINE
jgi:hypothetical protein